MYVIKLVIDREHETELCLVDELTKQNKIQLCFTKQFFINVNKIKHVTEH